jgi:hypothetical protein
LCAGLFLLTLLRLYSISDLICWHNFFYFTVRVVLDFSFLLLFFSHPSFLSFYYFLRSMYRAMLFFHFCFNLYFLYFLIYETIHWLTLFCSSFLFLCAQASLILSCVSHRFVHLTYFILLCFVFST